MAIRSVVTHYALRSVHVASERRSAMMHIDNVSAFDHGQHYLLVGRSTRDITVSCCSASLVRSTRTNNGSAKCEAENLFATRPPIVTLWVFGGGTVRVRPAGRFATDNRLTELTIEPKLILPTRDA